VLTKSIQCCYQVEANESGTEELFSDSKKRGIKASREIQKFRCLPSFIAFVSKFSINDGDRKKKYTSGRKIHLRSLTALLKTTKFTQHIFENMSSTTFLEKRTPLTSKSNSF